MKPSSKYKEKSKKQEKQKENQKDTQQKQDNQNEKAIKSIINENDSNEKGNPNQSNLIFNTEKILKEHIVKYQTFRPFIEEEMSDDISKIVTVLEDLYEICIKLYETEEEENYEDYSFDLFCLIEELKIDKRDDNDIIKLMYILSYSLDKSIEYHNEKFYEDYSNHEKLKVNLIKEIGVIQNKQSSIFNVISNSHSNNHSNSTIANTQYIPNTVNTVNSEYTKNDYFSLLISSGIKSMRLSKEEIKCIERLTKEICFEIIDDLFTYFLFISRFLEQVTLSFTNLIVKFNLIVGEEKNLNKIFLEEYSILILKDVLLKVSKIIYYL